MVRWVLDTICMTLTPRSRLKITSPHTCEVLVQKRIFAMVYQRRILRESFSSIKATSYENLSVAHMQKAQISSVTN